VQKKIETRLLISIVNERIIEITLCGDSLSNYSDGNWNLADARGGQRCPKRQQRPVESWLSAG